MKPLPRLALAAAVAAFALLAACVDPDAPELGDHTVALHGGTLATPFMTARAAVRLTTEAWAELHPAYQHQMCTLTRIGPRHLVTTYHCQGGDQVQFYTDPSASDPGRTRTIVAQLRPADDEIIDSPHYPVVLVLDADVPWGTTAKLAWEYPGPAVPVQVVGAGHFATGYNDVAELRYASDATLSAGDADGTFQLAGRHATFADFGGPIYQASRLLGVSWECGSIVGHDCALSVPPYLDFLLRSIDWAWPHGSPVVGYSAGTILDELAAGTERVCQYACAESRDCVAYNFNPTQQVCRLMSTRTQVLPLNNLWRSAAK